MNEEVESFSDLGIATSAAEEVSGPPSPTLTIPAGKQDVFTSRKHNEDLLLRSGRRYEHEKRIEFEETHYQAFVDAARLKISKLRNGSKFDDLQLLEILKQAKEDKVSAAMLFEMSSILDKAKAFGKHLSDYSIDTGMEIWTAWTHTDNEYVPTNLEDTKSLFNVEHIRDIKLQDVLRTVIFYNTHLDIYHPNKTTGKVNLERLKDLEHSYHALREFMTTNCQTWFMNYITHEAKRSNLPQHLFETGPVAFFILWNHITKIQNDTFGSKVREAVQNLRTTDFPGENIMSFVNMFIVMVDFLKTQKESVQISEPHTVLLDALMKSSVTEFSSCFTTLKYVDNPKIKSLDTLAAFAVEFYTRLHENTKWLPLEKGGATFYSQKNESQKGNGQSKWKSSGPTSKEKHSTAKKFEIDRTAPKPGEPHKREGKNGREDYWCAKCNRWGNHPTMKLEFPEVKFDHDGFAKRFRTRSSHENHTKNSTVASNKSSPHGEPVTDLLTMSRKN